MRLLTVVFLIAACLQAQTAPVPARPPAPLPQIKQNGVVKQMFVDGKPFIMLAGELHNSSASGLEYEMPKRPSMRAGDGWVLDPEDHLAARLARGGDPEDVYFEETDTRFAIGWKGEYRIEGSAFVYIGHDSGRMVTILGYRSAALRNGVDREISNMFG